MRLIFIFICGFLFAHLCVNAQDTLLVSKSINETKLTDKNSLDQGTAIEMVDRYRRKRWRRMKRAGFLGYRYDAGSAWFCIDKLREFEESVNRYLRARSADTTNPRRISGFRFYYMMYKRNDPHAPTALKDHVGKRTKKIHSLLIVATEYASMEDGTMAHKDIIDEAEKRVVALIMNEGTLCPPLPISECKGAEIGKQVYPTLRN